MFLKILDRINVGYFIQHVGDYDTLGQCSKNFKNQSQRFILKFKTNRHFITIMHYE